MAKDSGSNSNLPQGVRGPGGPATPPPGSGRAGSGRAGSRPPGSRSQLERRSLPLLLALQRFPRWLIVILMALCLFLGLIQTGGLAWLGGILMLVVAAFLGWLLILSWPVVTPSSRVVRSIVVAAVVGLAILKFLGRF